MSCCLPYALCGKAYFRKQLLRGIKSCRECGQAYDERTGDDRRGARGSPGRRPKGPAGRLSSAGGKAKSVRK